MWRSPTLPGAEEGDISESETKVQENQKSKTKSVIKAKDVHCCDSKATAKNYLPWSLHALPQAEVHYGENEKKAKHQLPANPTNISQPRWLVDLKNIPPVETKDGTSHFQQQDHISQTKPPAWLRQGFPHSRVPMWFLLLTLTCTYV